MAVEEQFLTPADVALRVRHCVKTVYRAIDSGALIATQPTSRYLIRESDYQRWVSSRRSPLASAAPREVEPPLAPAERGSVEELRAIEREGA